MPDTHDELLDHRDPAHEARELTGRADARVLEPSPPAVTDEWFADDPVAGGPDALMPAGMGSNDWNRWLDAHPDATEWLARRWLGGPRTLGTVPPNLPSTRASLHRLAAYVIAPARHRTTGKFGLRCRDNALFQTLFK